jgi:hypothetical protein
MKLRTSVRTPHPVPTAVELATKPCTCLTLTLAPDPDFALSERIQSKSRSRHSLLLMYGCRNSYPFILVTLRPAGTPEDSRVAQAPGHQRPKNNHFPTPWRGGGFVPPGRMEDGLGAASGGCHPRLMSDTPPGCVPTITHPPDTLSPTGGEGKGEGSRFVERVVDRPGEGLSSFLQRSI